MKIKMNTLCGMTALILVASSHAQTSSITRVTAFDYDSKGNLTKEIVEPERSDFCVVSVFGYDEYGNRLTTTARNCNGSAGSVAGQNSEAPEPTGAAKFTPRTSRTEYGVTLDPRLPTAHINALLHRTTVSHSNAYGKLIISQDPNGAWQASLLGPLARVTMKRAPDDVRVLPAYKYCSIIVTGGEVCPMVGNAQAYYLVVEYPRLAVSETPIGPTTKTYLDGAGRVIRFEAQGFDGGTASRAVCTDTTYDHLGRVKTKSLPYYVGDTRYDAVYSYDVLNRPETIVAPDGSTTRFTYAGLTADVTDSLLRRTITTLNDAGLVASVTDAASNRVINTYDPFGNLTVTLDAQGNRISHTYDATARRKISSVDPDRGQSRFTYDALGQNVAQYDNTNNVFTFSYDLLGRAFAATAPDLNRTFTFDNCPNGIGYKCLETADNGYAQAFSYDTAGRLSGRSTTVDGAAYSFTYAYSAEGRLATQGYPNGFSVTHVYTPLGYLRQLSNTNNPSAVYWTANAADALSHLTQETYGNQIVSKDVYDERTGRLSTRMAGASNGVQNLTLTYDTLGNLKTRFDGNLGNSASYTYDDLNRLRTEDLWGLSFGTTQSIVWTYDAIGNIKSRSDVGIYSYPASGAGSVQPHAVASILGSVNGVTNPSYAYDSRGNLLTGASRTVTWTSLDMPQSISQGNTALRFVYRADLGRFKEQFLVGGSLQRTTLYLHPGNSGQLEYEQEDGVAGLKRKYFVTLLQGRAVAVVTQVGAAGPFSTQYLHQDQLGSVSVVTNEAQTVVERLNYEPFGKRRLPSMLTDVPGTWRPTTTDRGFTAHEHLDEVGLVHMNGRVYDPAIGRFMSADPTDFSQSANMQSRNAYAYVLNNPLARVDPTGYQDAPAQEPPAQEWGRVTIFGHKSSGASAADGANGLQVANNDSGDGVSRYQLTGPATPEGLTQSKRQSLRFAARPVLSLRTHNINGTTRAMAAGLVGVAAADLAAELALRQVAAGIARAAAVAALPALELLATLSLRGDTQVASTDGTGNADNVGATAPVSGVNSASLPPGGPDDKEESEPTRVTNPKHHPNSNSPEPNNVDELFKNSVVDKNGVRWAQDADGTIHRFSKPSNGETHWNGSTGGTDAIQLQNIPVEVKRMFGVTG